MSDKIMSSTLENDEMKWAFLYRHFEKHGDVKPPTQDSKPECNFPVTPYNLLDFINDFIDIPYKLSNGKMYFTGTNCIDFLGKIYKYRSEYQQSNKYDDYMSWISPNRMLYTSHKLPECMVFKTDVNAITPSKSKESDVGYDLSIISEKKRLLNNVVLYDTGIKISVGHGIYAEVVPRSSLSKSGYMLANSIGIIDASYTGNIYIALVKISEDAQEITYPFRCCQLIFRQQLHVDMKETDEDLEKTSRNDGGFGSTGH
jgi:dUTP pyrophosphatase